MRDISIKKIILSIALFLSFYNFFAQKLTWSVELYMGTEAVNPTSKSITFHLDNQSPVFGHYICPNSFWYVTNYYDHSLWPTPINNNPPSEWKGWDSVHSQDNPSYPTYGFGLYKMSTNDSQANFYIDYRDSRYAENYIPYGTCDIWIKYNDAENKFYYSKKTSLGFTPITNGSYLSIWEILNQGTPSTTGFEDHWANALGLIRNGSYPRIVWGPYSLGTPSSYKVYRCVTSGTPINFVLKATVSSSIFEWTDYEYTVSPSQPLKAYYYVKALYSGSLSEPTNSVNTGVLPCKGLNYNEEIESLGYQLTQNHPNPVNPSTVIRYELAEKSYVTLRVYDVLGNEIVTLIEGYNPEGTHEVEFTAANNLPSGVYFYVLSANEFKEVKKMVLLR